MLKKWRKVIAFMADSRFKNLIQSVKIAVRHVTSEARILIN